MDRKDLILPLEVPTRQSIQTPEPRLAEMAEEAAILLMMTETRGWKLLMEKFITPRSALSRILQAQGNRPRDEAIGAVSELTELTRFVDGHIADGKSAAEQLELSRKQRRSINDQA